MVYSQPEVAENDVWPHSSVTRYTPLFLYGQKLCLQLSYHPKETKLNHIAWSWPAVNSQGFYFIWYYKLAAHS